MCMLLVGSMVIVTDMNRTIDNDENRCSHRVLDD